MRNIEFRVKDRTKNKWYYGCPIMYNDGSFSFYDTELIEKCDYCLDAYPYPDVDKNTLGQFTGLCDKNGKKVYEGDIVKTKYGRICKVVWHESRLCFDLVPIATIKNINYKAPDAFDIWYSKNLDVVGNIYDNPELLGGSDEECDN